jgi:Arylsulfotransferase (ASST)/Purple acid Phosphatase, N-terminal domain
MIRARASAVLALLLAGACGESNDPRRPAQVTAELSANISTVVKVRWTTQAASIGYVEFGPTRELGQNTPLEETPGTDHAATLLGLTADTEYFYRVVTWDGAATGASEILPIRTGDVPLGLVLTRTGDGQTGFIVVPVLGSNTAVIIINAQGQIVWYHTDDRKLDFYRARLSVDGKSLIYNAAKVSGDPVETSELVRVALDGSTTSSIPVPFLAHDFVEHADGTLAAITVETRDFAGAPLRGNTIVEIAPNGDKKTIWTSWSCFDPAKNMGDNPAQGWTFANALDYDPGEDVYYLGMRNFSSIARVNRATGACEWVLGLSASTFTFAPGAAHFLHQHQFQVRGNHILIMDNDGSPGNESRVLEYELDLTNKVATQVWSYVSTPSVYTFVLGEPIRFDDGSTFINWSAAGQMERLDPAGATTWKLNTGAGYVFGFHTLATSLYPAGARAP